MAKNRDRRTRRDARPEPPSVAPDAPRPGGGFHVFRETLESIVVAFVLAFLFRTYAAEAFVIPTGSMSPSLLGQHKDVNCPQCGYRFRTTASSEGEDRDRLMARLAAMRGVQADRLQAEVAALDVVGGICPMCRYLMPMRPDVPMSVRDQVDLADVEFQPSYPGDRILVNKFGLDFSEPRRWDVVVFKFPGDGNMNYIKRLVGMPGETLQTYQGDVFTRPLDATEAPFQIERKPADKVVAMLQPVHDTDYESSTLHAAGWPLRWTATTRDGWAVEAQAGEQTVQQQFSIDAPAGGELAWLRYRHLPATEGDWAIARSVAKNGDFAEAERLSGMTRDQWLQTIAPQLIADFNPYNARLTRLNAERHGWQLVPQAGSANAGSLGTEWVPDLAVECDFEVEQARGELVLDLVEAGYHFRATINLQDGKVELTALDGRTGQPLEFRASGQTGVNAPGQYSVRLANVDDQLLLWVDKSPGWLDSWELIDCGDATYDPDKLISGGREALLPWRGADGQDQGDLAPVGVGARGAKLTVSRLAVLRDIYYIATRYPQDGVMLSDYEPTLLATETLLSDSAAWGHFRTRRKRQFDVQPGQLFVMGDNSPESKDARLWMSSQHGNDVPGGPYLDRKLLIGKAVCVFWPHSWGGIPGLPKLPGWPNFKDMRLVR